MKERYFNRDLSWLRFNERVLDEAGKPIVPLMERIRFLAIFSSNLDEFYRVRMPVLRGAGYIDNHMPNSCTQSCLEDALNMIDQQQMQFGKILVDEILPELRRHNFHLIYNEALPSSLHEFLTTYFFNHLASFIEITRPEKGRKVFFENNKLYLAVLFESGKQNDVAFVNVPSDCTARFVQAKNDSTNYLVFIDDVIRHCLPLIFPRDTILAAYSFKITRDAELDLQNEYDGDIAQKIEVQLSKRDNGAVTRLLYQPGLPQEVMDCITAGSPQKTISVTKGGTYHNLKDLADLPVSIDELNYPLEAAPAIRLSGQLLLDDIQKKDRLVHPPYQSYDPILRFFNEAALNPDVEEIYTTVYRVANNSKILRALMSAAKNGKEVVAFVELKARFDEAHNIKWAKLMKAAGVRIIYSIPDLKVHAKIALVKLRKDKRLVSVGLLATGNLNENTARFYTDHVLFTSGVAVLNEVEQLFNFLKKRRHPFPAEKLTFEHLLVAQFNLLETFINLIDQEILNARSGLKATIIIKLNNLEEQTLIEKLYEASNAGVGIELIVRSVCRLVPGVQGMSENIRIRRIVDRYLEHGRIFIFHNAGEEKVFLGSCDWMNRNIYSRIEVCFPVYDKTLQEEIKAIIDLQLADNVAAVVINPNMENIALQPGSMEIRSQERIAQLLAAK